MFVNKCDVLKEKKHLKVINPGNNKTSTIRRLILK